ncbi:hypothetical protein ACFVFS_39310 [Kitasatospora sp. NPDC057692]|uniref:hypothetical protein n=1 Tax=Kitasatospora sp. NPDC057692 TaxID=3346215 RepID=UPI0036C6B4E9
MELTGWAASVLGVILALAAISNALIDQVTALSKKAIRSAHEIKSAWNEVDASDSDALAAPDSAPSLCDQTSERGTRVE